MSRARWWRYSSWIVVGGLAARAVALAWQYYFTSGPRYRVESAVIALVVVGAMAVAFRPGSQPVNDTPTPPVPRGWLLLLVLGAVAIYSRAIGLGFLSDDFTLRAMAQSDTLGAGTGWFFRPLPLVVWRGLLAVADAPAVLHLLNVLLHGLNACLVAVLGHLMGLRRGVAYGAAVVFVTFPILPEAVAWAAGIQDVLMTTMALSAVVLSARDSPGAGRIALVCGAVVLGFASKETAVCIPVLIALCWLTRERLRRDARLYVAVAVVTAAYLVIRLSMGIGSDYLASPSRYFIKQMVVIAFGTLAEPWREPASIAERWQAFTAVGVILVLIVHAGLTWRRSDVRVHRDLRLATWVLASIAPVFTFFFVGPTLEGSRYLYLAACAWSLLLADLIAAVGERLPKRSWVFAAAVAVIATVFTMSVQREIAVWQSAADLRERVLADARTTLDRTGCANASFADVPDSVSGAYVFRNGFPEAMGMAVDRTRPVPPGCTFTWNGGGFAQSR